MSQGMVPVMLFSAYDVRVISLPDKSVSPTQLLISQNYSPITTKTFGTISFEKLAFVYSIDNKM